MVNKKCCCCKKSLHSEKSPTYEFNTTMRPCLKREMEKWRNGAPVGLNSASVSLNSASFSLNSASVSLNITDLKVVSSQ